MWAKITRTVEHVSVTLNGGGAPAAAILIAKTPSALPLSRHAAIITAQVDNRS